MASVACVAPETKKNQLKTATKIAQATLLRTAVQQVGSGVRQDRASRSSEETENCTVVFGFVGNRKSDPEGGFCIVENTGRSVRLHQVCITLLLRIVSNW